MKHVWIAAALTLFMPVETSAQSARACEPRVAIGAAAGLLTVDIPIDPVLAGLGRFGLASATGTGLEGAVQTTVPIAADWNLKAELGAGAMAVAQERDATGNYVRRKTGDDVTIQRLQVGLQHHRAGLRSCGYASLEVGLYRYGYRGTALNVPGAAGTVGLEVPRSGSGTLFVEVGVSVVLTRLLAPTAAELVANIRPAVGWRYRF
jgi:hypothetical protein